MERDNTPFGGAQNAGNGSQPQIFSTDQTSQDKQSISSKLGTSRSRFNSRANRYAEQQANYSAAQSIAQNQNTPQFFSDAVMASTPAPVEPPKKSKAPLFIGLAVALVAVVAVVLVVTLMPKGDGDSQDTTRLELANIVREQYDSYWFSEERINLLDAETFRIESFYIRDDDVYNEFIADNEETIKNVKSLREVLGDERYSAIDNINEARDVLDKKIQVYERYNQITTAIVDATRANSSNDANEILAPYKDLTGMADVITAISYVVDNIKEPNKIFESNKCNENPATDVCIEASTSRSNVMAPYQFETKLNIAIKEYIADVDGNVLKNLIIELKDYAALEAEKGENE